MPSIPCTMCFCLSVLCPSGTYHDGKQCKQCASNSYQHQEAQVECIPCKKDRISEPGSFSESQCEYNSEIRSNLEGHCEYNSEIRSNSERQCEYNIWEKRSNSEWHCEYNIWEKRSNSEWQCENNIWDIVPHFAQWQLAIYIHVVMVTVDDSEPPMFPFVFTHRQEVNGYRKVGVHLDR